MSRVFVALCRARGFPARFASGTRLRDRDTSVYVDTVHHRWVEVFLPKYGWFPVDISMAVSGGDPTRRFGDIPARRLTMLRNAGIEDDPRFSSGLTLVEPHDAIDRTLRSYWFQSGRNTVGKGLAIAEKQVAPGWPGDDVRDELLKLRGDHAIPFLAIGLEEPVAQGNPGPFIETLERLQSRAAVVPLADLAANMQPVPRAVQRVLEQNTGCQFECADQWSAWLRNEGRRFLRNADAQSQQKSSTAKIWGLGLTYRVPHTHKFPCGKSSLAEPLDGSRELRGICNHWR